MTDRRITDFAALTGALAASGDLVPVVDISDTSEAATGLNVKMTLSELAVAVATLLAEGAISNAKLPDMAAATIKGRASGAGTGDQTDLTAAEVKTILGLTAPTVQVKTVGSGTYTTPAGCTAIIVEVIAGGGGGGGADGNTSNAGCGGGGGAGGYARKIFAAPDATYAYTAGAKGTGGTAGNNAGTAGSDSTFSAGGSLVTAKGGNAGSSVGVAATTAGTALGGAQTAVSTGGTVNVGGAAGTPGIRLSGTQCVGGTGGNSFLGGGGQGSKNDAVGGAAIGYGSGGGGAAATTTTDRAGGDGLDGVIVVTEFYD